MTTTSEIRETASEIFFGEADEDPMDAADLLSEHVVVRQADERGAYIQLGTEYVIGATEYFVDWYGRLGVTVMEA